LRRRRSIKISACKKKKKKKAVAAETNTLHDSFCNSSRSSMPPRQVLPFYELSFRFQSLQLAIEVHAGPKLRSTYKLPGQKNLADTCLIKFLISIWSITYSSVCVSIMLTNMRKTWLALLSLKKYLEDKASFNFWGDLGVRCASAVHLKAQAKGWIIIA
jgi:hypothetical protein